MMFVAQRAIKKHGCVPSFQKNNSWIKRETPPHTCFIQNTLSRHIRRGRRRRVKQAICKCLVPPSVLLGPLESGGVSYWPPSCLSLPFQVCIGSGATEEKHNQLRAAAAGPPFIHHIKGPCSAPRAGSYRQRRAPELGPRVPLPPLQRPPSGAPHRRSEGTSSTLTPWYIKGWGRGRGAGGGAAASRRRPPHRDAGLITALWRCVLSAPIHSDVLLLPLVGEQSFGFPRSARPI